MNAKRWTLYNSRLKDDFDDCKSSLQLNDLRHPGIEPALVTSNIDSMSFQGRYDLDSMVDVEFKVESTL